MNPSDRTWQALEIVCPEDLSLDTHEQPPHDALARVVYDALWTVDCGPLTLLSLPGRQRQRTLLRAGSPPQNPTRRALPDDTNTATAAAKQLAQRARRQMPAGVGLGIVDVDTTPLGNATARTHRVLAKDGTTTKQLQTTPPLLEGVIASLWDQPHALSVTFQCGPNKTIEISIRLVEFDPTAQIETRDEFAAAHTAPSVATTALSEAFRQSGYTTMTNWQLPEHTGWSLETSFVETPEQSTPLWRKEHARARNDTEANLGMTLATTPHEYREVFKQTPGDPLVDHYKSVGLCSRLESGCRLAQCFCTAQNTQLRVVALGSHSRTYCTSNNARRSNSGSAWNACS